MSSRTRAADVPWLVRPAAFVQLLKLRLNLLVLLAVAAGYAVAASGTPALLELVGLLLGVLLASAGTSALNMALEWERDARMERTRSRPIPNGLVRPAEAFVFGAVLAVSGLILLALTTTAQATVMTAVTVVSYVCLYTPLKPRTTWNTVVGAVPGALPPLIGWAAASGQLPAESLTLFAVLFLWQFPHFFAIASIYREDYRRGGFAMLPVLDATGLRTAHRVVSAALLLVPVSLLPAIAGIAGPTYAAGALLLSIVYLLASVLAAWRRDLRSWRLLLRTSFVHLPGVFLLMMFDRMTG